MVGDENSDYRKSARQLEKLLNANGTKLHGGEVDLGPGWKISVLNLDQALEFVLPIGSQGENVFRNMMSDLFKTVSLVALKIRS